MKHVLDEVPFVTNPSHIELACAAAQWMPIGSMSNMAPDVVNDLFGEVIHDTEILSLSTMLPRLVIVMMFYVLGCIKRE